MSTSLAYHTQGIIGFQHKSFDFSEKKVIQYLVKKEHRCPKCGSSSVCEKAGIAGTPVQSSQNPA